MAEGGRRRGSETVADLLRSLALVVVLVVAIVVVTNRSSPPVDVHTVDYVDDLASARDASQFPLLAPVGLEAWRPTSVRFDTPADGSGGATVWHLGFYTPGERYAAIDQSDGDAADFINDTTQGATATPSTVRLGELEWTRFDGGGAAGTDDETRALVNEQDGVVTLVSGSAEWPELEQLAVSLRSG